MSADLEQEERLLGKWPRRLLYVPNLTSYPWQPGNSYNGVLEPEYNAITYTWGRWRLEEGERLEVKAINISIDGDDWPIPRVKPEHFTVRQFELAIWSAASWSRQGFDGDDDNDDDGSVDFVWLDIACIAQRHDAQSAAEIGRQALVFRGAKYVFMWLTTMPETVLKETVDDMLWYEGGDSEEEDDEKYFSRHSRANRNLVRLLNDPWFTSLWTLQEAFLRQDAYLLSSDPNLIPRRDQDGICDMADILVPCASWIQRSDMIGSKTHTFKAEVREAHRLIESRGLKALFSQHEISTYVAAQRRETTNEEDRIYGLQQVFNLRLGKTALNSQGREYKLPELEDQFGEALLLQHPIHSQMHVYTTHVPAAKRWRIRSSSRELHGGSYRLPNLSDSRLSTRLGPPPTPTKQAEISESLVAGSDDIFDSPLLTVEELIWNTRPTELVLHSTLSIEPQSITCRSLTWKGRVCQFQNLWELFDRMYRQVHLKRRREVEAETSIVESHPLPDFPLFVDLDVVEDKPSVSTQNLAPSQVLAVLEQRYPCAKVHILLLASCWPAYTREGFTHGMFGLLMVEQRGLWERIGVSQWSCKIDFGADKMRESEEDALLISGNGDAWVEGSGVWGILNQAEPLD